MSTKQLAAQAALDKMARNGWLDITTLRGVVDALGVVPDADAMATLNLLHCVHFKDMPRELLDEIPGLIQRAVAGPNLRLVLPRREDSPATTPLRLS